MRKAIALFLLLSAGLYAHAQRAVFFGQNFTVTSGSGLTLTAHSQSSSCGNSTTCSVTLGSPIATGDWVEIICNAKNGDAISSASVGGTTVDDYWRSGLTSGNYWAPAHIYPATSTSGPMVITFAATSGGAQCSVLDFAVSGGTPKIDATCDQAANTGLSSPVTGCSMTLTGTNDVVIEGASADVNVTAINSPFSGHAYFATDETGAGTSFATGLSSGFTAPNWTAASVTAKEQGGIAIGFSPTPSTPLAMLDFSGGTNAVQPTPTTLYSSMKGATGSSSSGISGNQTGEWTVTDAGSKLTFSTSAHKALLGSAPRFLNSGATYSDAGSLGLSYATASSNTVGEIQYTFPYQTSGFGVSTSVQVSSWFQTTMAQTATINCDCLSVIGSGSGGTTFANMILTGNGTNLSLTLEALTAGSPVNISSSTWYEVATEYIAGGAIKLAVYDATGLQVGTTLTGVASSGPATLLSLGNALSGSGTAGASILWDKVQFCYLGCSDSDFPLNIAVKVATPVPTPGPGTSGSFSITLAATNSSSILYTTNGTTPACPATGTLYTGTAISITVTSTLKAIGCSTNPNWISSAVFSGTYTIATGVTFDVAGAGASGFSGTTITAAHTITNALPNTAIVAVVHWELGGNPTGCTWNGTAMTQMWNFIETGGSIMGSAAYILATGTGDGTSHNLVCTGPANWQNNVATLDTMSFGGVNQTTAFHNATTSSTLTSLSVATVSGDMGVDGISDFSGTALTMTTTGGTSRFLDTNPLGNGWSGAASTVPATGTQTMSYTTHGTVHAYGAAAIAHQ